MVYLQHFLVGTGVAYEWCTYSTSWWGQGWLMNDVPTVLLGGDRGGL